MDLFSIAMSQLLSAAQTSSLYDHVAVGALLLTALLADPAFAFHSEYTLPLPSELQHEPSYAIRIPYGAASRETYASYYPIAPSIPAGMTVVWFNDDVADHTVTTITKAGPQQFDSGVIPMGAFSILTFTKSGSYEYYCKIHPFMLGKVNVDDQVVLGRNLDMRIGGNIPFNATELGSVVLSFVPKNMTLPPARELVYNITISNPVRGVVFGGELADIDGVLDLEILPRPEAGQQKQMEVDNQNNTKNYATSALSESTIGARIYGPDIGSPITGTYHIEGPVLTEPVNHYISVQVISIDGLPPQESIKDSFTLPQKIG